ncbi:hypothetical protein AVEN_71074-1 [Araneus ventricosus]|uniref:Uncharacterized protein n=1 Tax=Araneus ventricosus TaxID=182803 RepID=A0A4Y2SXF8_ARAVE|nr:hypothetical protein AVEN_71074-1 [Araneus ventricosus]
MNGIRVVTVSVLLKNTVERRNLSKTSINSNGTENAGEKSAACIRKSAAYIGIQQKNDRFHENDLLGVELLLETLEEFLEMEERLGEGNFRRKKW